MSVNITELCTRAKVGEVYKCISTTGSGYIHKPGNRYTVIDAPVVGVALTTELNTEATSSYCHDGTMAQFKKVK